MEIATEELAASQLESELSQVIEWLDRNRIQDLYVTFGVGSGVAPECLWQPIRVGVEHLNAFVRDAIDAGWFAFGSVDLHIYDPATFGKSPDGTPRCEHPALRFTFCHESDMHFLQCEDNTLVEDMKREWMARGYAGYESTTENQFRNWVPFK